MILKFARIIKGRGALAKLGSDLAGRLLQYALLWVAARQLSQGEFGDFTFALSVGYMLAQVADFGLQMFVQRELARLLNTERKGDAGFSDPEAAGRLIGGGLLIKGVLSVAAMLLIVAAVYAEPVGNRGALVLLGLAMVLGTGLDYLSYCFRALGKLGWEAWAGLVWRVLNLALGVCLLALGAGVWGLALAYVLATVAAIVLSYRLLLRYVRPLWRVDLAYWRGSLTQPTAVGIGVIFSIITFRLDNLLIPPLLGREALAVYNVAYKLFEPSLIVPGVLLAATFPLLARSAHAEALKPNALRELLGQTTLALLGLGMVAALLLALLSGPMIGLLYGATYAASAPILAWLALACVPMYINYGLTHALIAVDKPRLYALFTLVSLAVNLGLNLALIPSMGLVGAALTTIAAELALLVLCAIAVYRHMGTLKSQSSVSITPSPLRISNPKSKIQNPKSRDLELPT
jgi:O-antigen/teichoic acid export membrane protein